MGNDTFSHRTNTMCGTIEGVYCHTFTNFDAVTSVRYDKVQVVLLGIGISTYDWQITKHEMLFN